MGGGPGVFVFLIIVTGVIMTFLYIDKRDTLEYDELRKRTEENIIVSIGPSPSSGTPSQVTVGPSPSSSESIVGPSPVNTGDVNSALDSLCEKYPWNNLCKDRPGWTGSKPSEPESPAPVIVEPTAHMAMDADYDGVVNFPEFFNAMSPKMESTVTEDDMFGVFRTLDTDEDGVLSTAEFNNTTGPSPMLINPQTTETIGPSPPTMSSVTFSFCEEYPWNNLCRGVVSDWTGIEPIYPSPDVTGPSPLIGNPSPITTEPIPDTTASSVDTLCEKFPWNNMCEGVIPNWTGVEPIYTPPSSIGPSMESIGPSPRGVLPELDSLCEKYPWNNLCNDRPGWTGDRPIEETGSELNNVLPKSATEMGYEALSTGNYTDAIVNFTDALSVTQESEKYMLYNQRSIAYTRIGEFTSALNDANKIDDSNSDVTKLMKLERTGDAMYGLGAYTDAKQLYEMALIINPDSQQLPRKLGLAEQAEQITINASTDNDTSPSKYTFESPDTQTAYEQALSLNGTGSIGISTPVEDSEQSAIDMLCATTFWHAMCRNRPGWTGDSPEGEENGVINPIVLDTLCKPEGTAPWLEICSYQQGWTGLRPVETQTTTSQTDPGLGADYTSGIYDTKSINSENTEKKFQSFLDTAYKALQIEDEESEVVITPNKYIQDDTYDINTTGLTGSRSDMLKAMKIYTEFRTMSNNAPPDIFGQGDYPNGIIHKCTQHETGERNDRLKITGEQTAQDVIKHFAELKKRDEYAKLLKRELDVIRTILENAIHDQDIYRMENDDPYYFNESIENIQISMTEKEEQIEEVLNPQDVVNTDWEEDDPYICFTPLNISIRRAIAHYKYCTQTIDGLTHSNLVIDTSCVGMPGHSIASLDSVCVENVSLSDPKCSEYEGHVDAYCEDNLWDIKCIGKEGHVAAKTTKYQLDTYCKENLWDTQQCSGYEGHGDAKTAKDQLDTYCQENLWDTQQCSGYEGHGDAKTAKDQLDTYCQENLWDTQRCSGYEGHMDAYCKKNLWDTQKCSGYEGHDKAILDRFCSENLVDPKCSEYDGHIDAYCEENLWDAQKCSGYEGHDTALSKANKIDDEILSELCDDSWWTDGNRFKNAAHRACRKTSSEMDYTSGYCGNGVGGSKCPEDQCCNQSGFCGTTTVTGSNSENNWCFNDTGNGYVGQYDGRFDGTVSRDEADKIARRPTDFSSMVMKQVLVEKCETDDTDPKCVGYEAYDNKKALDGRCETDDTNPDCAGYEAYNNAQVKRDLDKKCETDDTDPKCAGYPMYENKKALDDKCATNDMNPDCEGYPMYETKKDLDKKCETDDTDPDCADYPIYKAKRVLDELCLENTTDPKCAGYPMYENKKALDMFCSENLAEPKCSEYGGHLDAFCAIDDNLANPKCKGYDGYDMTVSMTGEIDAEILAELCKNSKDANGNTIASADSACRSTGGQCAGAASGGKCGGDACCSWSNWCASTTGGPETDWCVVRKSDGTYIGKDNGRYDGTASRDEADKIARRPSDFSTILATRILARKALDDKCATNDTNPDCAGYESYNNAQAKRDLDDKCATNTTDPDCADYPIYKAKRVLDELCLENTTDPKCAGYPMYENKKALDDKCATNDTNPDCEGYEAYDKKKALDDKCATDTVDSNCAGYTAYETKKDLDMFCPENLAEPKCSGYDGHLDAYCEENLWDPKCKGYDGYDMAVSITDEIDAEILAELCKNSKDADGNTIASADSACRSTGGQCAGAASGGKCGGDACCSNANWCSSRTGGPWSQWCRVKKSDGVYIGKDNGRYDGTASRDEADKIARRPSDFSTILATRILARTELNEFCARDGNLADPKCEEFDGHLDARCLENTTDSECADYPVYKAKRALDAGCLGNLLADPKCSEYVGHLDAFCARDGNLADPKCSEYVGHLDAFCARDGNLADPKCEEFDGHLYALCARDSNLVDPKCEGFDIARSAIINEIDAEILADLCKNSKDEDGSFGWYADRACRMIASEWNPYNEGVNNRCGVSGPVRRKINGKWLTTTVSFGGSKCPADQCCSESNYCGKNTETGLSTLTNESIDYCTTWVGKDNTNVGRDIGKYDGTASRDEADKIARRPANFTEIVASRL